MERVELQPRQSTAWLVTAALVTLGVVGRLWQPEWNVTPLAAVTLFAGAVFSRAWMAALVPVAVLAISNLWLRDYTSRAEMLSVYACFLAPLLFRGLLRERITVFRVALSAVSCTLIFYVVTNFAVWMVRRGLAYDDSLSGLRDCYVAALPFLRWMLQGDLFYAALVFGSFALCRKYMTLPRLSRPREYQPVKLVK